MFHDILEAVGSFVKTHTDVAVFGIPKSGLPYAEKVALYLERPLQVIPLVKVRMAALPFIGLGSISSDGVSLNNGVIDALRIKANDIAAAIQEAQERLGVIPNTVFGFDRVVLQNLDVAIIVDDAIASGFTASSAASWVSKRYTVKQIVFVCDVIDENIEKNYRQVRVPVFYAKKCSPNEMHRIRTSQNRNSA